MSTWSPADLLPGLVCALLAALLLGALRRWYDPVPHRIGAVFALALLALFAPVLLGGRILLPLDNLRGHVPFQDLPPTAPIGNLLQGDLIQLIAPAQTEVRRALAEGRWPLWNPHSGAGVPLLADPQAQAFQPLQLATWFLSVPRAAGVTATLRVLLALTFTFLLLRRMGLGEGAALAGALAFGLGGFVALWVGWPIATSAALLPAVLYALARLDQESGRRDLLLFALVTAALLLGGHPETIATVLLFALAVLLDRVRRRPRGARLDLLRRAALAGGLALAVAAPVLLPVLDALPDSLRAARLAEPLPAPTEDPAGRTFPARLARRALLAVAPSAFGNTRQVHYWGPANTNEDAGAFAGTAALLLAGLALLPLPGKPRLPRGADATPPPPGPASELPAAERSAPSSGALWAGGLALAALIVAARPPGLDLLLNAIPPLRALLTPRLLLFTGFGLAVLAAFGLERLQQDRRTSRVPVVALLGLAGALAALVAWAYLAHPDPQGLDRLAIFRDGSLRWQLRFLAAAALLVAVGLSRDRGRRWLPPAAALLLATELLLAHRAANPPMPRELAWPTDPALEFLQKSLWADPGARFAGLGRTLPPNLAGLYGLADARVYNPAAPLSFFTATAPLVRRWWGEVPEWGRPRNPLYPRLGVRYLLTAPGERLPPPLQLAFEGDSAWIYGVPGPWPLLALTPWPSLPRAGERGRDATGGGGRLALKQVSFGEAWIWAKVPAAPAEGLPPAAASLSPPASGLASTLLQDGHWRLLVDGRPHPATVDGPFFAAALPPGIRRIDLFYRPFPLLAGCLLAAFGLAAGLAALVPRPGGLQ